MSHVFYVVIVKIYVTLQQRLLSFMLKTVFSFTPFFVCFWWLITFMLAYHKADTAKRTLTYYIFTCVILYFCHALYFTDKLPQSLECLWTLCSLCVYPLYYIYICRLTSSSFSVWLYASFLPGVAVAIAKLLIPDDSVDIIRQVVFVPQMVLVCYFGYKRLVAFDSKLTDVYVDMEGRSSSSIKRLLVAIFLTSFFSALANMFGRRYFGQTDWLLVSIATAFSILQYALCYIGYHRHFSIEQFEADSQDDFPVIDYPQEYIFGSDNLTAKVGKKVETLMEEQKIYLKPNLKIAEVVKQCGVCRTYVSNYINQTGNNFSEYINKHRVEHAKTILSQSPTKKMVVVSEESGFTSEASFYRNFRKFTGLTPQEWLNQNK